MRVQSKLDWDLVSKVVLNKRFLETVYRKHQPTVYIEMPISIANETKKLTNLTSPVALHFTGWENYDDLVKKDESFNVIPNLVNQNIKIGFSVEDCATEINQKLARFSNISMFSKLDYLVCHTKPVIPNNDDQDWINGYFNTMFYIKQYIETFAIKFLGVTKDFRVHFRLNLVSESSCEINATKSAYSLLRFLNDANQHSLAYQINYFIVKAFESEGQDEECSKSFWKLQSYENLNNISVFVDKEEGNMFQSFYTKKIVILSDIYAVDCN